MRIFLLVCLCFSFSCYAVAKENDKIQTQGELNDVSKNEFDKTNKELTDLYFELGGYFKGESREKYIIANTIWFQYRDAHCDAITHDAKGGSAYNLFYFSCLIQMTNKRIELLKLLYQDMSQKTVKGKPLKNP